MNLTNHLNTITNIIEMKLFSKFEKKSECLRMYKRIFYQQYDIDRKDLIQLLHIKYVEKKIYLKYDNERGTLLTFLYTWITTTLLDELRRLKRLADNPKDAMDNNNKLDFDNADDDFSTILIDADNPEILTELHEQVEYLQKAGMDKFDIEVFEGKVSMKDIAKEKGINYRTYQSQYSKKLDNFKRLYNV